MGAADGTILDVRRIVDHGADTERWNVVILGDGFQASEISAYQHAADAFVEMLSKTRPFSDRWSSINVHRFDVASTDSGVKDPSGAPCGGTGATPRTRFDSTLCANGQVRRWLLPDTGLVEAAIKNHVPGWHVAVVIANTTVYGGASNGQVGAFSLAKDADQIALHELGHSYFGLADEYDYYDSCATDTGRDRYSGPEPEKPNVTTNVSDPAFLKWDDFVSAPVSPPTMLNPDATCRTCDRRPSPVGEGMIGLFEGAFTYKCGVFRPAYDCKMRTLGQPFCTVCQDAIRDKLDPFKPVDCFVGTALYRDPDHPDVELLRAWRDCELSRGGARRRMMLAAVRRYSTAGPRLARYVSARPGLACALRGLVLRPAVTLLRLLLTSTSRQGEGRTTQARV